MAINKSNFRSYRNDLADKIKQLRSEGWTNEDINIFLQREKDKCRYDEAKKLKNEFNDRIKTIMDDFESKYNCEDEKNSKYYISKKILYI